MFCVDHISVLVCRHIFICSVCHFGAKKKKGKGIKQMQCLLLLESFMFRALGKWDKDSANVYNQLGKTMKTGFIVSH